jgi:23S rRNA (pseudouridine1915-N3)-methyltransferase
MVATRLEYGPSSISNQQLAISNQMRITVLAVGKLRPVFRAAADEYLGRLAHYADAMEIEVREAGKAPSPAEALRREGKRLQERLEPDMLAVALDRGGPAWSSEELAARLERWRAGAKPVAVLVGGSHGLDADVLRNCHERWSLGPITLPHELARVVAYEQLYRGFTILRGERYHK